MKMRTRAFLRDSALLFAVAVADQIIKTAVRRYAIGAALFECPLFTVRRAENPGAAFGLFASRPALVTAVSALILIGLAAYMRRAFGETPENGLRRAAWILLFGGAAGNLADRLLRGTVTDYIQMNFIDFPLFNLADCCITVSVLLYIVIILREGMPNGRERAS